MSLIIDSRFDGNVRDRLVQGCAAPFLIDILEPDFPATGLRLTSFVDMGREREFSRTRLLRKRGRLEGQLLKRFQKWL